MMTRRLQFLILALVLACARAHAKVRMPDVRPVAEAGITGIRCRPQPHPTGIPYHPEGAVFGNETRPTFDWISPMHSFTPTDSHR